MSVGIIENIPLRQGGTRLDGHQNHSNKACGVRSIDVEEVKSGKSRKYYMQKRI